MTGYNVHRIVAGAYRRWLPTGAKYFMAPYSIRKGPNVYGLVFGSGHPRGIDKFLRVAWAKGGDANFFIDRDRIDSQTLMLPEMETPNKLREYEAALRSDVLNGKLGTNKEIYIFGLEHGVLASHSRAVIDRMLAQGDLPKQTIHISYDAWAKQACGEQILLKEDAP
ncbi:MAG: hypothetical protein PHI34_02325 [Acidobacteriota bacterium]|nr:hypothetical protein [Acidobacteriota bacterium]